MLPEIVKFFVLKTLPLLSIFQAKTLTYKVCPLLTAIDKELKVVVVEAPVETEKLLPIVRGEVKEASYAYWISAVPVEPSVLLSIFTELIDKILPDNGAMVN